MAHKSHSVPGDSDCPSMAFSAVVSPAAEAPCRPAMLTPADQNSSVSTFIMGVPPGTPVSVSSRMVSIRSTLQRKGFSVDVPLRIASAHCLSTQSVYNSKWRLFCDWSAKQGRDPSSTTTPQLADFLTFLFKDKHFALSTIVGYRMTIVNTLEKVTGTCPTDDHLLSSLLSQFEVERPRPGRSIPSWDLALVLHALHAAPFEPLAQAPLWALTFISVFLVTFASANVAPNCTLSITEFSTRRTGLALCFYRTHSSWLRLRGPATPILAYRKSRSKPSLRLLAPISAPTPTAVWSMLSRFICHAPRRSAAVGSAFSSLISWATTTRLRHLRSCHGWSRQFAIL